MRGVRFLLRCAIRELVEARLIRRLRIWGCILIYSLCWTHVFFFAKALPEQGSLALASGRLLFETIGVDHLWLLQYVGGQIGWDVSLHYRILGWESQKPPTRDFVLKSAALTIVRSILFKSYTFVGWILAILVSVKLHWAVVDDHGSVHALINLKLEIIHRSVLLLMHFIDFAYTSLFTAYFNYKERILMLVYFISRTD